MDIANSGSKGIVCVPISDNTLWDPGKVYKTLADDCRKTKENLEHRVSST